MASEPKAAHAAIKPHYDKLPAKAPPYLQADWTKFRADADKLMAALLGAAEPADIVKKRAEYTAKKAELAALKAKIGESVTKQKDEITKARTALRGLIATGNAIGQVVKDKTNEPASAAIGRGIMMFAANAQKELGGLKEPASPD
jgi:hypothetical protein